MSEMEITPVVSPIVFLGAVVVVVVAFAYLMVAPLGKAGIIFGA